ncbi:TA2R7 protein, partial [Machaerirhynchus nigripectus]|nr:TA2R7 protein [Machaerirhynchus nigripectus]
QQSNVTSFSATTLAIITLEAFAGMWINAFLVSVLCFAWVKKKALNSNEKILLLLGCCRFWHLCFSWVYSFLSIIYPNYLYVHPLIQLLAYFQNFSNCSNLWFCACLCVFYCIKIANFRNSCFIYLKVNIDRIVPWLLLGSVLSALAIAIIAYEIAETVHNDSHNFYCLGNFWEASVRMDKYLFPFYFLMGFGYAAPFTAVIFSAVFLLFSLWRHKRTMQTNSMNSLSVDAHIRAMKSILSFVVMYSINFVCLILTIIYAKKNENTIILLIFIYLYAFPGVHSLVLIFSNPKLEKALLKILSCVKCK